MASPVRRTAPRETVTDEPAWLLARRPHGETAAWLDVYTLNQGRLSLTARGLRKPGAKLAGALQPFVPLRLDFSHGPGGGGVLTNAVPAGPPLGLTGERVLWGWYVLELLLKTWPEGAAHPELFAALGATLAGVADAVPEESATGALRRFEASLLAALGDGPWPGPEQAAESLPDRARLRAALARHLPAPLNTPGLLRDYRRVQDQGQGQPS